MEVEQMANRTTQCLSRSQRGLARLMALVLGAGLVMVSAGGISLVDAVKPPQPSVPSSVHTMVVSQRLPLTHQRIVPTSVTSMAALATAAQVASPNIAKPDLPPDVPDPNPVRASANPGSISLAQDVVSPANLAPTPAFGTRGSSGAPSSSGGFAGLTHCGVFATCYELPNSFVAVNSNDIVQVVHQEVRISNRAGKALASIPFTTFFTWPKGALFDPHVLWDQAKGRWLMLVDGYDCANGYLHLAVSASADPMGAWKFYTFTFPKALEDYDGLGFSSDKVVLAADQYPFAANATCGQIGGYNGASLVVLDWSQLLAGSTLTSTQTTPEQSLFSWHPATSLSATNTISAAVEVENNGWDPGYASIGGSNAAGNVRVSSVLDLTSAGIASTLLPLDVSPFGLAGESVAEDGRLKDALWQNGKLWFVTTSSCTPAGDQAERDCVRITELDTSGTTPSLVQDFLMGQIGYDFFVGGIGLTSNGALTIVFSASSASTHINTYAAVQGPDAPINTYSPLTLVKAGRALYTGQGYGRWGDYVGVAQDPANPNAVWAGDEYPNAAGTWSTWISQLTSDVTPPVGSFSINGGAPSSADPLVAITDSATDVGSGVSSMAASNDGSHWHQFPYAHSFSWDLTDPAAGGTSNLGAQTIYLRWQDRAGNWSAPLAHSVNLMAGA